MHRPVEVFTSAVQLVHVCLEICSHPENLTSTIAKRHSSTIEQMLACSKAILKLRTLEAKVSFPAFKTHIRMGSVVLSVVFLLSELTLAHGNQGTEIAMISLNSIQHYQFN